MCACCTNAGVALNEGTREQIMKKPVSMMFVGFMFVAAPLAGCAVDTQAEEEVEASTADSELVSAKSAVVSFSCKGWDKTCRDSVRVKLVAARARNPEAALVAIDKATQTPAYTSVRDGSGSSTGSNRWSYEDNGFLIELNCDYGWFYLNCKGEMSYY